MLTFILSLFIILIMYLEKLFFFNLERNFAASFLGRAELIFFTVLSLIAIFLFLSKHATKLKSRPRVKSKKIEWLTLLFLSATAIVIGLSFYINYHKISIHWDAVALYDARAKFLDYGISFSEMPLLSQFDSQNKYYYLLYPPFTSISHFYWGKIALLSQIPVSVYYSVTLLFLITLLYLLTKESLGSKLAGLLALIVASNNSIFNVSIKEYTNLPFALYLIVGIFFIYSYLRNNDNWKLLFGIILVASSIWIRLLEPMWTTVVIAFGLTILTKTKDIKKLFPVGLLLLFCLIQYFAWTYFVNDIAKSPGFLNFSYLTIFDSILALLTGGAILVLEKITLAWGIPLLIHLIVIFALILKWRIARRNREIVFLGTLLLLSLIMYFTIFYIFSFQVDWWANIAKSLDRSSSFLIPISGYLLLWLIINSGIIKSGLFKNKRWFPRPN